MKAPATDPISKQLLSAPAFSHTGPRIFHALRVALTDSFGFQPSFSRLGRIVGRKTNLVHYWFNSLPHHHLIGFFSLLERLPEPERIDFLRTFCRELPRFDNPRISHDPSATGSLENLLEKDRGLTWIQGGPEYQRTWLLTGFGHSFARMFGEKASVGGLDIHEPRKFVPVETLLYLKEPLSSETVKGHIRNAWPSVTSARHRLLLFNGVWSATPELREAILDLASKQHVVLTVDQIPEFRSGATWKRLITHIVTLSPVREHEQWIRLKVQAP